MKIIANNVGDYRNKRDNCLWYSGEIINIETDHGSYKISSIGNTICQLRVVKEFVDYDDIKHEVGEILVDILPDDNKNFLDEISKYINSDEELEKVLKCENEKFRMDFHNNKSLKIDFFDKEGNPKEPIIIDSSSLDFAIKKVLEHIKENRTFDNNKYSVYCRSARYSDMSIQNQLYSCKNTILSKETTLTENDINYYIDNGFSSIEVFPPSLEMLSSDLNIVKSNNIVTYGMNRLSKNINKLLELKVKLEESDSNIYLIKEDDYLHKGAYSKFVFPILAMNIEQEEMDIEKG